MVIITPISDKKKSTVPEPDTVLFGGDYRDRTGDLLHAMQALSQLSYTPTYCGKPQRNSGVLTGIRTPVPTVKGSCPRPLDDEDNL